MCVCVSGRKVGDPDLGQNQTYRVSTTSDPWNLYVCVKKCKSAASHVGGLFWEKDRDSFCTPWNIAKDGFFIFFFWHVFGSFGLFLFLDGLKWGPSAPTKHPSLPLICFCFGVLGILVLEGLGWGGSEGPYRVRVRRTWRAPPYRTIPLCLFFFNMVVFTSLHNPSPIVLCLLRRFRRFRVKWARKARPCLTLPLLSYLFCFVLFPPGFWFPTEQKPPLPCI